MRSAASYGAFIELGKKIKTIVGVVSPLTAFIGFRTTSTCSISQFLNAHCLTLYNQTKRTGILSVPQLNLSNGILFDGWTEIKQKDGHSCGIRSLTLLEMKLSGAVWREQFYHFQELYRVRLLLLNLQCLDS
ncbi:hypothetical protein PHMEG_00037483 [Phytophthora megakarya]|uniref:Uncharacterized protein n=1 Tax=Phytophthora megakarya TaxID=4795 RepID=A0A225UKX8_9STRA|nr:hypothetical protein PHMEG_00037483 [Phytophthora megakarya]